MDWTGVLLEPGFAYRTVGSLALHTYDNEEALLEHLDLVKPKGELDLAPSLYFRRHWMPDVGPAWNSLICVLRDLAMYESLPQASAPQLARYIGVSRSTIHNMLAFWRVGPEHLHRAPRTWTRADYAEFKRWFGVRLYIPELLTSEGRSNAYLVSAGDHKHIKHRPDLWPHLSLEQPAWLFDDEWDAEKQCILARYGPVSIYSLTVDPSKIWRGGSGTPPESGGVGTRPLQNLEGFEDPNSTLPGTTPPNSGGVAGQYLGTTTTKKAAVVQGHESESDSQRCVEARRKATAALLEIGSPNDLIEALTASLQLAELTLIWAHEIGPTKRWWPRWDKGPVYVWVRAAVTSCATKPKSSWAAELRDFQAKKAEPEPPPAPRALVRRPSAERQVVEISAEMVPFWEIAAGVIDAENWKTWGQDCRPCDVLELALFIHCPNSTARQWLSQRFGKALAAALHRAFPHRINTVRFVLPGECDVCRNRT